MTSRSSSQPNRSGLTQAVDAWRGAIRVGGHLTVQGADLLRGTVEALNRGGHGSVVLDLQDLRAADEAGLRVLRNMRQSLAADGGELLFVASPPMFADRL